METTDYNNDISRWSYRTAAPPHSKAVLVCAELSSAAMWWWIFWHFWHDSAHITVGNLTILNVFLSVF